ncbi:hypothetical protein M434DRAFT_138137 [Hypoxylon sp. CO27-5]|nr:hypothetical protein M434DRAFT_138137 [Hypoxylon sp. CO27-5]
MHPAFCLLSQSGCLRPVSLFWLENNLSGLKGFFAKTAMSHHMKGFRQGVTFPVARTNETDRRPISSSSLETIVAKDARSPPRKGEVLSGIWLPDIRLTTLQSDWRS